MLKREGKKLMGNRFSVTGKAVNKSFIGRDKIIKEFKKLYFKNSQKNRSIVAFKKIGKSSFVFELFKDIPKDILYIYEDLSLWNKYIDLWKSIFRKVASYLNENSLMTEYLEEKLSVINTKADDWEFVVFSVEKIFESLAEEEIKTIIVLDNFDNAIDLFEQQPGYWMLFRSIFSESRYNVSGITISRRSLPYIEKGVLKGSTLSGIFEQKILEDFDDDDMKKYYQVFENMKITLDDKQRKEIEYYCGRFPYLLSIMGQEICELAEDNENIDIKNVFENKKNLFDKYYKDINKYFENEEEYEDEKYNLKKPNYFEEHKSEFGEQKETKKYGFSIPQTEAEWKELITEPEGTNIECKSSLQYDMNHKKLNPVLRQEVIKSVSAFLNTDGGKLFIGVEDEKRIILGIENDYTLLAKKDRNVDSFELILRDILSDACGTAVIANNVLIKFPVIDGKEICAVIVRPSSTEVFTKDPKNEKIFYIRSGNSTRKLDVSEVTNYINSHFKK